MIDQKYICSIEHEIESEGIRYQLITCSPSDIEAEIAGMEFIGHFDFWQWLQSKEYLEEIAYIDFIENELDKETLHEYLLDHSITNLAYDSSLL
jgi:hypothetical protein